MDLDERTYRCPTGIGGLYVVADPDDEWLRVDAGPATTVYLTRNQVRCLMHQLTDWLVCRGTT